jgi:hypothetical protein
LGVRLSFKDSDVPLSVIEEWMFIND